MKKKQISVSTQRSSSCSAVNVEEHIITPAPLMKERVWLLFGFNAILGNKGPDMAIYSFYRFFFFLC